jgi:hypothetical protein
MPFLAIPKETPIEKARKWFGWPPQQNRPPKSLAFAFSIAAKGYGLTEDEVRTELMLTGRFSEGSTTVERAIANAFGNTSGVFQSGSAWPEPDVAEVERIVAAYPRVTLNTLRQSPRNRTSTYTQAQIIEAITYPKQLVCAGLSFDTPMVWPVETILDKRSDLLPKWEFIVANPMTKRSGRTKPTPGKPSRDYARTADNASKEEERRWVIVECDFKKEKDGKQTIWAPTIEKWEEQGISVKDAATRLLAHLLSHHHQQVSLVVDSGGASLHCWINARAFEAGKLKEFQDHACVLGADPASYRMSQFVRFPGGTRASGNRQEIVYFNNNSLPGHETGPGSETEA